MRLNSLQTAVLKRLSEAGATSAYRLGVGLNTLNALAMKRLIKADRSNPGCFLSPRTAITWEITAAGRALLPNGE